MKAVFHTESIDVAAIRVGMFVHLDVGWMSHPFPLSSFRITTPAQVATIRSLGIERVRWSPEQSDPAVLAGGPEAPAPHGEQTVAAPDGEAANDAALDAAAEVPVPVETIAETAAAAIFAAASMPDAPAQRRSERRDAQVEALRLCEHQYAEAARACKSAFDSVEARPHEARAQVEALTRALLDKMVGSGDLCIRMLVEGSAEKASSHAVNVGIVSLLMGRALGLADDEMHDLGVGALLHDVGKLDLPARLRWRDDSFSPSEVRVWEEHVELGVAQARRLGLSAGAAAVIAQHHEHADRTGFPARLHADRMSVAGRIVALVNTYDNLCNPRLLARALTPHDALSQLFAQARTRFDAPILSTFIRMLSVYPPGSTVQLTDDRYAQVVAVNASRPLKPSVVVFDPKIAREEALVCDLETMAGVGIRRSLKPQQLPPAALDWLAPAPRVAYFFEPSPPVATEPA